MKTPRLARPIKLYTGDKSQGLEGIKIRILATAYARMMMYINECSHEVSGLGRVKKTRKKDSHGQNYDEYLVTDIRIFQQTSDDANTNLRASGQFGMAAFFEKMMMEGKDPSGWHCWWHSHVNMGARFSSVDEATCRKFFEEGENGWHLEIVGNKQNEFQVRFDRFGEYVDFDDKMELEIVFDQEPELLAEVRAEIAQKVVRPSARKLTAVMELDNYTGPPKSKPKKGMIGQVLGFFVGDTGSDKKPEVKPTKVGEKKAAVKSSAIPPLPKNIPAEPYQEIVDFRKLSVPEKTTQSNIWFEELRRVVTEEELDPNEVYRLAASKVKESEEQLRLMIRFCEPDYVPVGISDGERIFMMLEAARELASKKPLLPKTWEGTAPLDRRALDDAESMRTLATFTLEDCEGLSEEEIVPVACAWMQELVEIVGLKEATVESIASVSGFGKEVITDKIAAWSSKQYVPLVEHAGLIYRILGAARKMAAVGRWITERDRIAAGLIRDFKACTDETKAKTLVRAWCDEVYVLASSCLECKDMNKFNIIQLSGLTSDAGVEKNVDDILNCRTIEKWEIKNVDLPRILAVVRMISGAYRKSLEEETSGKVEVQTEPNSVVADGVEQEVDSDDLQLGDPLVTGVVLPDEPEEERDEPA